MSNGSHDARCIQKRQPTENYLIYSAEREKAAWIFKSPVAQFVFEQRRQELETYTAVLSVRAASSFAPVIRFPSGLNNLREKLSTLATMARSKGPRKEQKASQVAERIGRRYGTPTASETSTTTD